MLLNNKDLIKEFYEEIKSSYPDLTLEEVREVCHCQFKYLRRLMESGSMESMRLKYLGTFSVLRNRAKFMLNNAYSLYSKSLMSKEEYQDLEVKINKFLNEKD